MNRRNWQASAPPLILASASQARRSLLGAAGLAFECLPSHLDEAAVRATAADIDHAAVALLLAETKASFVSAARPDALVIGADQIVSADGIMFGKPDTKMIAREQLAQLRGKRQTLHTAVVLARKGEVAWRHVCAPVVTLRQMSDRLLDLYVEQEGDLLLACAGACRVEGPGQLLIHSVEGEHAAILGLPLLALLAALRRLGVVIG